MNEIKTPALMSLKELLDEMARLVEENEKILAEINGGKWGGE